MLTLGLMEGVLSATFGALLLFGLANENAPLHRLLGPPVMAMVGLGAYLIHDSGRVSTLTDLVGLAFFVCVAFILPLAVMRAAWKATKNMQAPTATQRETSAKPRVVEVPAPVSEPRAAA